MFLFAHLAAGYVAARLWNLVARTRPISIPLAILGGILPDLIDKPLALLPGWDSGRSIAHSLLFLILLGLASIHYGHLRPIALGVATHLLLDDPTVYAATLFWPLLGPSFTPDDDLSLQAISHHLAKPRTTVAEIAGGLLLFGVAAHHAWTQLRRARTKAPAPVPQRGRPVNDPNPFASNVEPTFTDVD